MAATSAQASAPEETQGTISVPLMFYTTTYPMAMPETTMAVPVTALPDGLNQIVNSTLDLTPAEDFDFLINDEYVTTTLEKFIRRRGLNFEEVLQVEYTPSMHAQEGSKLPHDDWVSSVRAPVAGHSNVLLTGSYDNCVRLWNGEECIAIGSGHSGAVKEVALHPGSGSALLASGGQRKVGSKRKAQSEIGSFQFASASKDGKIAAWAFDAESSSIQRLGTIGQHVGSVDTIDVLPFDNGRLVCTGSWDCSAKIFTWDQLVDSSTPDAKKQPLAAFTDHARPVMCSRFSPSRAHLMATAGLDGNVKIWDINKTQLLTTLHGEHAINSFAMLPGDGHDLVVTGHTDNRIRVYDTRQKTPVKSIAGHRQWVYGVTWCWRKSDGTPAGHVMFASGAEDATVRLWDMRCTTNSVLTMDKLHTDGVLDVTFVGGNEVASCGKDNKTKSFVVDNALTK